MTDKILTEKQAIQHIIERTGLALSPEDFRKDPEIHYVFWPIGMPYGTYLKEKKRMQTLQRGFRVRVGDTARTFIITNFGDDGYHCFDVVEKGRVTSLRRL